MTAATGTTRRLELTQYSIPLPGDWERGLQSFSAVGLLQFKYLSYCITALELFYAGIYR